MANATTPGRAAPTLPGPPTPERDWPAQAADTIERVVGQVRDKTTGPALTAARAVVYGLFGGIVAIACLVVLIILLVRFIDAVVLPDSIFGTHHVWLAYLILGVVFVGIGAVLWSRRRPREEPSV